VDSGRRHRIADVETKILTFMAQQEAQPSGFIASDLKSCKDVAMDPREMPSMEGTYHRKRISKLGTLPLKMSKKHDCPLS
jgi:hypothetical protein